MSTYVDYYSFTALPLKLYCRGIQIASATGFFRVLNGAFWLVSNWHVFSGRDPRTGLPNNKNLAIPDEVSVVIHSGDLGRIHTDVRFPLIDLNGENLWFQHERAQLIDIAALRLPNMPLDTKIYDVVGPEDKIDMSVLPGSPLYVLGFPLGMNLQKCIPIWKRASIASEPDLPVDGMEIILVDSATRSGMSGAPTFAREFGSYLSKDGGNHVGTGTFTMFVGIYSGRYGAEDEFGAQIGRIWKRSLVEEVIENPFPGDFQIISTR